MNKSPLALNGSHHSSATSATHAPFSTSTVNNMPVKSPVAKTVYFYKDGDYNSTALKIAITPKKYRSFDTLLGDLSTKLPGLSFGVRSIYTPHGHNHIDNLDSLSNEGHYVCSTHAKYAKGLDISKLGRPSAWHYHKPPSGRRLYNNILAANNDPDKLQEIRNRRRFPGSNGLSNGYPSMPSLPGMVRGPKKITVMKNGDPISRHIVLLNRRTAQSFEQVLSDLSEMFKIAVKKLYTVDGRRVQSLSALINGPDLFVVASGEAFKPMAGLIPLPPSRPRPANMSGRTDTSQAMVSRLRERRELQAKSKGLWKVSVSTSELPTAGTQSQVSITLYGSRGNSGPTSLQTTNGTPFQSGQVDEFEIVTPNIGELYKIRLSHDNMGDEPGWFCNEVKMFDMDSDEELQFTCQRWLSHDEDDGAVCRELPVVRKHETVLPVLRYQVSVVTGDLWNSGTKANVYLTIYGDRGDTGVRQLYALNSNGLFQQGETDVFHIEAVSLGALKRIIIGHDGTEPGQGWFLEKIIIKESNRSRNIYEFYCEKWFDEGEDDGKIVREIRVQEEYLQDVIEKRNWEFEKWKFDHHNQVMLYCKQTGRALRIKADSSIDGLGEAKEKPSIFNVIAKRGMVRVFSSALNNNFHLAIESNRLVGQYLKGHPMGKGGAFCEFRVHVQSDHTVLFESVKYPLQFASILQNGRAGDPRGIAPDPNQQFFVYCKGMFRHRGIIFLCTSTTQTLSIGNDNGVIATGKKSRLGQFRVYKVEEGVRMFESISDPGHYLRMKDSKVDCLGEKDIYSQFLIEKHRDLGFISLQSVTERGLYIGMTFDGFVRPTIDTGVKNVRFYPEIVEFGTPKYKNLDSGLETVREVTETSTVHEKSAVETAAPEQISEGDLVVEDIEKISEEIVEPQPEPVALEPELVEEPESEPLEPEPVEQQVDPEPVDESIVEPEPVDESVVEPEPVDESIVEHEPVDESIVEPEPVDESIVEPEPVDESVVEPEPVDEPVVEPEPVDSEPIMSHVVEQVPVEPDSAFEAGDWKVKVSSAETLINGQVVIVVYGEKVTSLPVLLSDSTDTRLFQSACQDEFKVNLLNIGEIYKVRIEVFPLDKGEPSSWRLYEVLLKNVDTQEILQFPFDKTFSWKLDEGGHLVWESALLKDSEPVLPLLNYQVYIHTSDANTSISNSEVFLNMEGERGDTGNRLLLWSNNVAPFQNGQVDQFVVEAVSLGSLTSCYIHTEGSDTNDEWHIEKVVVRESPFSTTEYLFQPENYLTIDDDGCSKITIPLTEMRKAPEEEVQHIEDGSVQASDWHLELTTSDVGAMNSESPIMLYVYCETGVTGPIILGQTSEGLFQGGQTDNFKISVDPELGDPYKIRLGYEDLDINAGWFLEKVVLTNLATNEKIISVPPNRWLSRCHDDCDTWREYPVPKNDQNLIADARYVIETYTGHMAGSATSANVYVSIIGNLGDSGKRYLYRSAYDDKFQEGQVDEFQIEAVWLGDISSLVIGHDTKEAGEGWYLEKVIITETVESDTRVYHFECNRWLDAGQDDCATALELLPSEEHEDQAEEQPAEPTDIIGDVYTLHVKTSEKSNVANQMATFLTVYGERMESDNVELTIDDVAPFHPGETNDIELKLGDLGELYKIRLCRDDPASWQTWVIDEIKITDQSSQIVYEFDTSHLTSQDFEVYDMVREFPVLKDGLAVSPVTHYIVQVYTGDRWAAETDAQVSVNMIGSHGDSGNRALIFSTKNVHKFRKGQIDTFIIEAVLLGELKQLLISHDGKGHGAGWFLEKVVIMDRDGSGSTLQYVFPCGRWLDTYEDDGKTERLLRLIDVDDAKSPQQSRKNSKISSQGRWKAILRTSALENSGTHAQIWLTVCGESGQSDRIALGDGTMQSDLFQPNKESEFMIDLRGIGDIFKIRLEHDNSNPEPNWHLDYVKLIDIDTDEHVIVYVDRWFAVDEEDGQICREFHIHRDGAAALPALRYMVAVSTGQDSDPEAEPIVYLDIHGEHGNIGLRPLTNSKSSITPWRPGQTDIFIIEAVSVGKPQNVELKYTSKNATSRWNLTKIVIAEGEMALTQYEFPSEEWFHIGAVEDTVTKQFALTGIEPSTLSLPKASRLSSLGQWTVLTYSGVMDEGLVGELQVNMVVYGTKGQTSPKQLCTTADMTESVNKSRIMIGDIGRIYKIRVYLSSETITNGTCFLQKIMMKDDGTEEELHFHFNDSLRMSAQNPHATIELPAIRPDIEPLAETTYTVTVHTGDVDNAETEADIYCMLIGQWGDTGKRPLVSSVSESEKLFQRGQVDSFEVKALNLGTIQQVVVGHTNSTSGAGMFLDKVVIEDAHMSALVFSCNNWLDAGEGDLQIERDLYPASTDQEISVDDTFMDSTVGQTQSTENLKQYHIRIDTSTEWGSGTNSNIYIIVHGESADSGRQPLTNSLANGIAFETGKTDRFIIDTEDMGVLKNIVLGHDGAGPESGWKVDKVAISEGATGKVYVFPCNIWLDSEQDDGQTEREFACTEVIEENQNYQTTESQDESAANIPEIEQDEEDEAAHEGEKTEDANVTDEKIEMTPDNPNSNQTDPEPASDP